MKYLISMLLLLAVLLTACGAPRPVEIPTLDPDASTTKSGITVKTDYSAYSTYTGMEPLYTRLSEDFISDLRPSDDYGMLYPFAGSTLTQSTAAGYAYTVGYLYGMIDNSGRIVVDPVYSEITLLVDQTESVEMPLWLLSRTDKEEGDELSWGSSTYALASLDGSFVTDCIYDFVFGYGTHAIAVQEGAEEFRFDLFDLDGNLILASETLPFRDELSGAWRIGYGEELLTVALQAGVDENGYEICSYYFADLEGNLVLGPYQEAEPFSDGLALVWDEAERSYAFIDHSGSVVCGGYSYADHFRNGTAVVTDEATGRNQVIDATGAVLIDTVLDVYYIERRDSGYWAYGTTAITYYDTEGNLLYGGPVDDDLQYLTDSGIFLDRTTSPYELVDMVTGQRQAILTPDSDYAYNLYGTDYYYVRCWDQEGGVSSYVLMDETFSERLSGVGFISSLIDPLTYDVLPYANGLGKVSIYDAALTPLFEITTTSFDDLSRYGDRIRCTDDFSCSYFDLEGNLIFHYPLINSMED